MWLHSVLFRCVNMCTTGQKGNLLLRFQWFWFSIAWPLFLFNFASNVVVFPQCLRISLALCAFVRLVLVQPLLIYIRLWVNIHTNMFFFSSSYWRVNCDTAFGKFQTKHVKSVAKLMTITGQTLNFSGVFLIYFIETFTLRHRMGMYVCDSHEINRDTTTFDLF